MKKFLIFLAGAFFCLYSIGFIFCQWTYPVSYRALIQKNAELYQLDPLLIGALIFSESRYQREAVSSAGAMGLMQLMPQTAEELAKKLDLGPLTDKEYFGKEVNIQLGCFHLAQLKKRSVDEPAWFVLAAYNAGEAKVRKWREEAPVSQDPDGVIQYPETQKYVKQVRRVYCALRFCSYLGLVR